MNTNIKKLLQFRKEIPALDLPFEAKAELCETINNFIGRELCSEFPCDKALEKEAVRLNIRSEYQETK